MPPARAPCGRRQSAMARKPRASSETARRARARAGGILAISTAVNTCSVSSSSVDHRMITDPTRHRKIGAQQRRQGLQGLAQINGVSRKALAKSNTSAALRDGLHGSGARWLRSSARALAWGCQSAPSKDEQPNSRLTRSASTICAIAPQASRRMSGSCQSGSRQNRPSSSLAPAKAIQARSDHRPAPHSWPQAFARRETPSGDSSTPGDHWRALAPAHVGTAHQSVRITALCLRQCHGGPESCGGAGLVLAVRSSLRFRPDRAM